jgi:hypothetical protein
VEFPVSGVECSPALPPLVAFAIACFTAPAGLSGAFLLLPFQISVLGFVTPGVVPTNLLYNAIAIPGGVYRYTRENRMMWRLALFIILGTLPGIFLGAHVRIRYLADPRVGKLFVGLVLLYLAVRLLSNQDAPDLIPEHFSRGATRRPSRNVANTRRDISVHTLPFRPGAVLGMSTVVGVIGGIYGIGGGAIIAPFLVTVLKLPVYAIAGATLFATFVTSIGGVVAFEVLSRTGIGQGMTARPDWALGALFGAGGFCGTYAGAALQKHLPERRIRTALGLCLLAISVPYIAQFFG